MSAAIQFDLIRELPHLKRFAFSLARTNELAEDLVQDCVERALKYEARYERGTNLRAWLFRMMRNLRINQIRHVKCREKYLQREALKGINSSPPIQENSIQMMELKAAFKRLPMFERAALMLVTIEGYSYADAADRLGCKVGTVKSRVFRVRQKLLEMEIY